MQKAVAAVHAAGTSSVLDRFLIPSVSSLLDTLGMRRYHGREDVPAVYSSRTHRAHMIREEVMNSVCRLREAAGVTQKDLAGAVDVSRQTIVAVEKGNYVPSVLLAMKIAKYFKKSVEEVFRIEKHVR